MLIAAGEKDESGSKRLSAYQTAAAKAGVNVRVVINPNAMHTAWSKGAERDRVTVLADYLSRN